MKAKLGPKAATMATAHKIAVIFYTMIKKQVEYDETIWDTRDAQREKRLEAKLKRQAKQLGYELVPIEPQPAYPTGSARGSSLEDTSFIIHYPKDQRTSRANSLLPRLCHIGDNVLAF